MIEIIQNSNEIIDNKINNDLLWLKKEVESMDHDPYNEILWKYDLDNLWWWRTVRAHWWNNINTWDYIITIEKNWNMVKVHFKFPIDRNSWKVTNMTNMEIQTWYAEDNDWNSYMISTWWLNNNKTEVIIEEASFNVSKNKLKWQIEKKYNMDFLNDNWKIDSFAFSNNKTILVINLKGKWDMNWNSTKIKLQYDWTDSDWMLWKMNNQYTNVIDSNWNTNTYCFSIEQDVQNETIVFSNATKTLNEDFTTRFEKNYNLPNWREYDNNSYVIWDNKLNVKLNLKNTSNWDTISINFTNKWFDNDWNKIWELKKDSKSQSQYWNNCFQEHSWYLIFDNNSNSLDIKNKINYLNDVWIKWIISDLWLVDNNDWTYNIDIDWIDWYKVSLIKYNSINHNIIWILKLENDSWNIIILNVVKSHEWNTSKTKWKIEKQDISYNNESYEIKYSNTEGYYIESINEIQNIQRKKATSDLDLSINNTNSWDNYKYIIDWEILTIYSYSIEFNSNTDKKPSYVILNVKTWNWTFVDIKLNIKEKNWKYCYENSDQIITFWQDLYKLRIYKQYNNAYYTFSLEKQIDSNDKFKSLYNTDFDISFIKKDWIEILRRNKFNLNELNDNWYIEKITSWTNNVWQKTYTVKLKDNVEINWKDEIKFTLKWTSRTIE